MTNVQIRDVPDDVLGNLKKLATNRGQSLQKYLLDLLQAEAAVHVSQQIFAEAAADHEGYRGGTGDAAETVRRGRRERETGLVDQA